MIESDSVNTERPPRFYSTSRAHSDHYAIIINEDNSNSFSVSPLKINYNRLTMVTNTNYTLINSQSYVGTASHTNNGMEISQVNVSKRLNPPVGLEFENESGVPEEIFEFAISPSSLTASEDTIHSAFTLSGTNSSNLKIHTYALGDVNHDGEITQRDQRIVTDFMLGSRGNFSEIYSNETYDISAIVNWHAADANRDGDIGMADIIIIGRML